MFRLRICDIHILADDTKRLAIAAGSKYPVLHFLCLVCKPMLPQSALSDPHQVKNIAVLPDQRAVRLFRLRRRFPDKPAQTVGDKIREPCATESLMGLQTPHGKFPNLQVHTLKGIEQTGRIIILKSKNILELRAVFQNTGLGEHFIDPVKPFLQLAAAALQNQAAFSLHTAKVLCFNMVDTQKIASYRCCWFSFLCRTALPSGVSLAAAGGRAFVPLSVNP